MVLAVEPMVCARTPGDSGTQGPVDGGDEGWVELGALRALHRGNGKWAVGIDAAVGGNLTQRRRDAEKTLKVFSASQRLCVENRFESI